MAHLKKNNKCLTNAWQLPSYIKISISSPSEVSELYKCVFRKLILKINTKANTRIVQPTRSN